MIVFICGLDNAWINPFMAGWWCINNSWQDEGAWTIWTYVPQNLHTENSERSFGDWMIPYKKWRNRGHPYWKHLSRWLFDLWSTPREKSSLLLICRRVHLAKVNEYDEMTKTLQTNELKHVFFAYDDFADTHTLDMRAYGSNLFYHLLTNLFLLKTQYGMNWRPTKLFRTTYFAKPFVLNIQGRDANRPHSSSNCSGFLHELISIDLGLNLASWDGPKYVVRF